MSEETRWRYRWARLSCRYKLQVIIYNNAGSGDFPFYYYYDYLFFSVISSLSRLFLLPLVSNLALLTRSEWCIPRSLNFSEWEISLKTSANLFGATVGNTATRNQNSECFAWDGFLLHTNEYFNRLQRVYSCNGGIHQIHSSNSSENIRSTCNIHSVWVKIHTNSNDSAALLLALLLAWNFTPRNIESKFEIRAMQKRSSCTTE